MKFYLEITLLPNPEVGIHFLWSKVYQQIHLGLVEIQDDQGHVPMGVAFPEYVQGDKRRVLGVKLRLFAEHEATLSQFNASHWLARLSDYVHCTSIRPVPEKLVGYATYQREQPKTNKERLARRYAKRHGMDLATALHSAVDLTVKPPSGETYKAQLRYCDMTQKTVTTPFIRLQSLSGGQNVLSVD
ncbi:type I-F CRISPR-associated endoribonuclease Cas6/Csy4 [Methylocucumis oryzae]|uniref:type I-F CRISPR-associated endoribonuclease Cas6/Csy4 n=1 Tax=Methylocucumis oryzae TaxID=1632867 RepID=UPI000AF0DFDC|nr:type I-F CRISPR-associated endoribonuclease Cas6/Csy4 [Methylocucumis oryzae]